MIRFEILFFSILSLALSCKTTAPSDPKGFADPNEFWNDYSDIAVCWLPSKGTTEDFSAEREFIQKTVQKTYEELDIVFTGWRDCASNIKSDLRVRLDPQGSRSNSGGFGPSSREILIGLDHPCLVDTRINNCLANVSLHEFGHVLGLHHEMNRDDQRTCHDSREVERGAVNIGSYDAQSIMDYCYLYSSFSRNEALGLSDGDKAALSVIKSRVFAKISGLSEVIGPETVEWKLDSETASRYRFKFEKDPCDNPDGYSEWRDVKSAITEKDIEGVRYNETVRLCLLASGPNGVEQALKSFSSYNIKITPRPKILGEFSLPKEMKAGSSFTARISINIDYDLTAISLLVNRESPNFEFDLYVPVRKISEREYEMTLTFPEGAIGRFDLVKMRFLDDMPLIWTVTELNEGNAITILP